VEQQQQQQQQQVVAGHTDDARGVVDVWRCSVCTYDNAVDLQSCDICGVARHNPADFLPTSKKASGTKKHTSIPGCDEPQFACLVIVGNSVFSSCQWKQHLSWMSWFTGL
jgi:hypothetical protein